ncbi:hypothetical protein O7632_11600 [Solwaraspora sp. WMMD406]|uniref:hypothetical protein n=1 Tax=Solwaraspora sp. WMMD406 TaxID=3016095 RepID=UPI00241745F0|nr:hypothetical protein [Solwaraspora sp. WMMD406]MDG4764743.1 hypothetical protein [Solwaraspora sp. WMMD406]
MSGAGSGWQAYPRAVDDHVDLPPVGPGRVVGVGAICDLRPQRADAADTQGFSVGEFVMLDDGRRVLLHQDRGFTLGRRSAGDTPADADPVDEARESVTRSVLTVVLSDDEEFAEEHPWSWLADLARSRGLDVSADDLRALPYEVILTDEVTRWLAHG